MSYTTKALLDDEENINGRMCKQFAANREHCANITLHNVLGMGQAGENQKSLKNQQ